MTKDISLEEARYVFQDFFLETPFVSLLPEGQMPKTSSVLGSNFVAMQVAVDDHTNRLIVSVAIDNLVKGAAGQAIQNANIICGFAENLGLISQGIGA
jgi:N-acetyl-gamma-glutamyl-phosphate reductase